MTCFQFIYRYTKNFVALLIFLMVSIPIFLNSAAATSKPFNNPLNNQNVLKSTNINNALASAYVDNSLALANNLSLNWKQATAMSKPQKLTPTLTPTTPLTNRDSSLPNAPHNGQLLNQPAQSPSFKPIKAINPPPIKAINFSTPENRLWNLQNADIRSVIDEISRETGKNFVIDPRVQGKITIVSSTPLDPDEVYKVFLSSLQVLGFAAVPTGPVIKIMPNADAKAAGVTVTSLNNPGNGDELVVRAIPLLNVSAMQLAPILRPLIPEWGVLSYYGPSNVIIVAGTANSVKRLAEIIHRVDTANTSGIDMMTLHYASALDVVNTIQSLETSAKQQGEQTEVSIAAEPASNSILMSGNKRSRLKMRVLITELDTPSANGVGGNTRVIYLHYLKAQDLVPVLAGVAKSYYRGPVGTVIGVKSKIGNDYTAISDNNGSNELSSEPQAAPEPSPTQPANHEVQTTVSETTNATDEEKPKVELIAEPNTNAIIINAPPTLMSTLRNVVAQLDVRPAQVLVEALIAEVDEATAVRLGIQWGAVTAPNAIGIAAADIIPGFRQGIGIVSGKGMHNLQAVINAIGKDQNTNILSTPAVLVLDNQQAKILVGQEISIKESNYPGNAGGTSVATPYNTFAREKVALHLFVTPQITQGKSIQLSIDQGNDTLQNPNIISTTPIINISSIKTSILVNSGDIIVLGGLIQSQVAAGNSRIPILGDIPVLGHLFKVDNTSRNKKDLMVFLRPIIVSSPLTSALATEDKYQFMRQEQLDWLGTQHYQEDQEENILPPLHPVFLPPPFEHDVY